MYGGLIAYWILFGVSHSLLAAGGVKSFFQLIMGNHFRYYRFYYSIFSFLLIGWILYFQYSYADKIIWQAPLFIRIIGFVLLIPALVIMLLCIKKYFFHLSGIDVFWAQEQQTGKLETGGLNSYVRHPLYTGTLLLVICLFLIAPTGGNLISAGMIILYTCVGTIFEEKKLRRTFGEAYHLYQQNVPMLIPFIKRRKRKIG